eukprot:1732075-Pyramimonas_sp.AAC.1
MPADAGGDLVASRPASQRAEAPRLCAALLTGADGHQIVADGGRAHAVVRAGAGGPAQAEERDAPFLDVDTLALPSPPTRSKVSPPICAAPTLVD